MYITAYLVEEQRFSILQVVACCVSIKLNFLLRRRHKNLTTKFRYTEIQTFYFEKMDRRLRSVSVDHWLRNTDINETSLTKHCCDIKSTRTGPIFEKLH